MNLAEANVLESGGGGSTIYFSKRARRVLTFEFDSDWGRALRDAIRDRPNVEVIEPATQSGLLREWSQSKNLNPLCEFSNDVEFESDAFVGVFREKLSNSDLVLIDGGPRNLAMVAASRFAKPSAIVVVDNSDTAGLAQGINALRKEGFREIPMRGLGPLNHYEWTTSFFIRDFGSVCLTR
jgi:predicted O-methyltransferase YrrM